MRLIAALVLLTLCTGVTYASLYAWVDTNRPPVSLADALKEAERLLGDDRARHYCINAHIYGNEKGDGKEGAWNLMFGCADGSRKHVYVNMQGKADIRIWNGPVDWSANDGRRTDLIDVRDRIVGVLESHSLEAETKSVVDSVLTITKSSRRFSLHALEADGGYSSETQEMVGPKNDGICIRVTHVNTQPPERPYRWQGPYWLVSENNYILADGKGFLVTEVMYGAEFPRKVVDQITQCFGERLP